MKYLVCVAYVTKQLRGIYYGLKRVTNQSLHFSPFPITSFKNWYLRLSCLIRFYYRVVLWVFSLLRHFSAVLPVCVPYMPFAHSGILKKKKNNTTQNNRMNVQHCCSSAFAFMNESAVCVHTGFLAARSARSAEKETFEAILCSDGGSGKAGLLLRT